MCGIVGLVCNNTNGFTQPEINAFKDMLYVNALRGVDATGIFYVNNTGDVQIHKDTSESSDFLKTTEWKASERELFSRGTAIVGHSRAATRGMKTVENAHPFIVDNKIVLVHNGTMAGSHKHLANTEVDSHAIAHVLSENADIATAISKINAAFALVWYNTETGYLHAIRNDERPLWMAETQNRAIIFASEPSFIYLAVSRHGLKLNEHGAVLLGRHNLMSVNLNNLKEEATYKVIECNYKAPEGPFQDWTTGEIEGTGTKTTGKVTQVNFSDRKHLGRWRSKSFITMCMAARMMGNGDWSPTPGKKESFDSIMKRNETIIIEPVDYCSTDDSANGNKHWYIFGSCVSVNEDKDGLLCGWEIQAANETAVLEYIDSDFFEGQVEFSMSMKYEGIPNTVTGVVKIGTVKPLDTDVSVNRNVQ